VYEQLVLDFQEDQWVLEELRNEQEADGEVREAVQQCETLERELSATKGKAEL
jgi:hypothetical protein